MTDKKELRETWKDVVGYEGLYQISNYGNIVSSYCMDGHKSLKPSLNSHGYFSIILCKDKKKKNIRIHKLVAEAFIGVRPLGYEINHKDTNKQNNHVSNLEYLTKNQNIAHAHSNGKYARGRKHPRYTHGKYVGQTMNKTFPGICYLCDKAVNDGDGYYEKIKGTVGWRIKHAICAKFGVPTEIEFPEKKSIEDDVIVYGRGAAYVNGYNDAIDACKQAYAKARGV